MKTSFAPKDFSKGGLVEADVTIRNPRFGKYSGDYGEQVTMYLDYEDDDGETYHSFYTVGKAEYIAILDSPRDDGGDEVEEGPVIEHADPDKQYAISPTSQAGHFFETLCGKAGFPENKLTGGSIEVLEGLRVHVKRETFKKQDGGDAKAILVPVALLEKGAKTKSGNGKSKANVQTEEEGDEATTAAVDLAKKILKNPGKYLKDWEDGEDITTSELVTGAFTALKGNPMKAAVTDLFGKKAFWQSQEDFEFDPKSKTVSLA